MKELYNDGHNRVDVKEALSNHIIIIMKSVYDRANVFMATT